MDLVELLSMDLADLFSMDLADLFSMDLGDLANLFSMFLVELADMASSPLLLGLSRDAQSCEVSREPFGHGVVFHPCILHLGVSLHCVCVGVCFVCFVY